MNGNFIILGFRPRMRRGSARNSPGLAVQTDASPDLLIFHIYPLFVGRFISETRTDNSVVRAEYVQHGTQRTISYSSMNVEPRLSVRNRAIFFQHFFFRLEIELLVGKQSRPNDCIDVISSGSIDRSAVIVCTRKIGSSLLRCPPAKSVQSQYALSPVHQSSLVRAVPFISKLTAQGRSIDEPCLTLIVYLLCEIGDRTRCQNWWHTIHEGPYYRRIQTPRRLSGTITSYTTHTGYPNLYLYSAA